MPTAAWGIDLGTTNSCIARASAATVDVIRIDEAPTVPSVLAWNGSEFLVGRRAANHAVLAPDQAVRSIKRHIADAGFRAALGGAELTPVDVSARILAYLKAQAELATGEAVEEAVITVPAWFNEPQRRATVAAGERAGLEVTRIINEPTAAGLAYGHTGASAERPRRDDAERWVVYDLGGGTFDVSILSVAGDYKEVLASCGNTYLGGDDFDHRMVLHWVDRLRDMHNTDVSQDRLAMAQLRHLAEQTKIRLSSEIEVPVQAFIENAGKRIELDEVLTRAQLAAMIEDYVESTLAKVRQALEEAQVSAHDVSRVLLVGGSTKMPCIQERVAQELNIEPEAYVDADLSVALGAAIQSSLDHSLSAAQIVVDIAPHALGIAALGDEDRASLLAGLEDEIEEESEGAAYPRTFAPVIRKNSRLPAKFVEEFCTVFDGQDGVDIVVLQGESSDTRENTLVGRFHAPFEPKPAGAPVYVAFEYDRNGLVRVSVTDLGGTKILKSHTLDLGLSAESNSEAGTLYRQGRTALEDDDSWPDDEPASGMAAQPKLTNFLVEQVERRLESAGSDEAGEIRVELERYRELLAAGRDSEIDEVEERLYAWVDGGDAPAAQA